MDAPTSERLLLQLMAICRCEVADRAPLTPRNETLADCLVGKPSARTEKAATNRLTPFVI